MTHYTEVLCPSCERPLQIRKEYSGKIIACNYCDHEFRPRVPVECPSCSALLHVRIAYLGQRITCKHCDFTFRAPRAAVLSQTGGARDEGDEAVRQRAWLEVAALKQQAQRLREEIAQRMDERDRATQQLHDAQSENARLQGQLAELQPQLDQARLDLQQAASLRDELDRSALNQSKQLDARTRELAARTGEIEALRQELLASQADLETIRKEVQQCRDLGAAVERQRDDALAERDTARRQAEREQATLLQQLDERHREVEAARQERDELAAQRGADGARHAEEREQLQVEAARLAAALAEADQQARAEVERSRELELQVQQLRRLVEEPDEAAAALRSHHSAPPDLAEDGSQAAALRKQLEESSRTLDRERAAFRAEIDQLAAQIHTLQQEGKLLLASRTTGLNHPLVAATERKYADLFAELRAVTAELERSKGPVETEPHGANPQKRTRGLSRLWSRVPGDQGEESSSSDLLSRRLDALRIDAVLERERTLRVVAEAVQADLEQQLNEALAQLRNFTEAPRGASRAIKGG